MKKSNKRAFTLIELLVTLIIIGVILVVSFPVMRNILRKQEDSAYNYHEKIVMEAAKGYVELFSSAFDTQAMCFNVEYENLLTNDLLKEQAITCDVNKDNNLGGVVTVTKNDDGFTYNSYLTCKNEQKNQVLINKKNTNTNSCSDVTEFFVITKVIAKYDNANGADYNGEWTNRNVYLQVKTNDPYMVGFKEFEYSLNDGATWIKGVNDSILITQNTNGIIRFRAYDKIGNVSTIKSQAVKIDKVAPTCSSSGGNSNWTNGNRTIVGTCSDTGGSGCRGNVTRLFSSNTDGVYSPGSVSDNAGNTAVCPTNQTVKIDKSAPETPNITNPTNGNWTNGNITLTLRSNDVGGSGISHWQYSYDNSSWITYSDSAATTYTPSAFSGERNQPVYIRVVDNAGNSATSNTMIRIDRTAPVITGLSNSSNGNWTNQNVTLSAGYSDGVSGLQRIEYWYGSGDVYSDVPQPSAGATSFTSSGVWSNQRNNTVYYRAVDQAGNYSGWSGGTNVRIDKSAPETPNITNPTNGNWTNGNITLTLRSNDVGGSGISRWQYSYDNSSWITYSDSAATTYTPSAFSAERNQPVYIRVVDNAGNSATSNTMIRIDRTAPVITGLSNSSNGNWTNQNVTLSAGYSDGVSGLQRIEYWYGSGTVYSDVSQPSAGATSFTSSGVWSTQRNNTVYYRAVDQAGNYSGWSGGTNVKIDKTAPNISFSRNGSTTYATSQCTTPSYSDSGGSGISSALYIWGGTGSNPAYDMANGSSRCYNSNTTSIRLVARVCDGVGNCTTNYTGVFYVDNHSPTYGGAVSCNIGIFEISGYTMYNFNFNASAASGISSKTFTFLGATRTSGTSFKRNGIGFHSQGTESVTITSVSATSGTGVTANFGSKTFSCNVSLME